MVPCMVDSFIWYSAIKVVKQNLIYASPAGQLGFWWTLLYASSSVWNISNIVPKIFLLDNAGWKTIHLTGVSVERLYFSNLFQWQQSFTAVNIQIFCFTTKQRIVIARVASGIKCSVMLLGC